MTKSTPIRIRGHTLWRLALLAEPLVDTPNMVLRRLLRLDPPRKRPTVGIRPRPNTYPPWVGCRVDHQVYRRLQALASTFDESVRRLLAAGKRARC
jgi:hypothetical protein